MTDGTEQPFIELFQRLNEVTVPVQKLPAEFQMLLQMKGMWGIVRTKEHIRSVQRVAFLPLGYKDCRFQTHTSI